MDPTTPEKRPSQRRARQALVIASILYVLISLSLGAKYIRDGHFREDPWLLFMGAVVGFPFLFFAALSVLFMAEGDAEAFQRHQDAADRASDSVFAPAGSPHQPQHSGKKSSGHPPIPPRLISAAAIAASVLGTVVAVPVHVDAVARGTPDAPAFRIALMLGLVTFAITWPLLTFALSTMRVRIENHKRGGDTPV